MRYTSIYSHDYGTKPMLSFGISCSECYASVDIDDDYCRRCGHKLRRIPTTLDSDKVCDLLTEVVKGNVVVPGVTDKSKASRKKEAKEVNKAGPEYCTPDKCRNSRKKVAKK